MSHHVTNEDEFNTKLEEAGDKLVVVDFFATWCGPCKQIAPLLEQLAKDKADKLVVIKVDVDVCQDLTEKFSIESMPTFIFFKNKNQVDTFKGANEKLLRETIEKLS